MLTFADAVAEMLLQVLKQRPIMLVFRLTLLDDKRLWDEEEDTKHEWRDENDNIYGHPRTVLLHE